MQDSKNSPALWRKIYADSKFILIYSIICKNSGNRLVRAHAHKNKRHPIFTSDVCKHPTKHCTFPESIKVLKQFHRETCIFESSLKNTKTQQGSLYEKSIGSTGAAIVSDDHGMLPSVSAKLIRRKVCEKNSVFCCVLAVEMLQDGKPTLIYAIVCKKPEENFAKENFMGHYFC